MNTLIQVHVGGKSMFDHYNLAHTCTLTTYMYSYFFCSIFSVDLQYRSEISIPKYTQNTRMRMRTYAYAYIRVCVCVYARILCVRVCSLVCIS